MVSHHSDRSFGAAPGFAGELSNVKLLSHAWSCHDGRAALIQKTNVKLLVSTGRRLQLNFFAQRILIVGAIAQHGSQHVQFVGKKQIRTSVEFSPQHEVQAGGAQEHERQSCQRIGRSQPKRKGTWKGRRPRRVMTQLREHSRHRELCEST